MVRHQLLLSATVDSASEPQHLSVAGELQKHQAEGCNAGARLLFGRPVAESDDDL